MSSLIGRARLHLANSAQPHLINRLDRETSGVVLIAKNSETAGELGKILESRAIEKEYLAIVHGHVREESGLIDAPLGKDENSIVAVKDCVRPDGASSQTEFWVERRFIRDGRAASPLPAARANEIHGAHLPRRCASTAGGVTRPANHFSLLRVIPHTGRKHQIRIHLAHIGHSIAGDKLYGGDEDIYMALVQNRLTPEHREKLIFENHALHARSIKFLWRGRPVGFSCEPEPWFTEFSSAD